MEYSVNHINLLAIDSDISSITTLSARRGEEGAGINTQIRGQLLLFGLFFILRCCCWWRDKQGFQLIGRVGMKRRI